MDTAGKFDNERGVATHIGKMRNETKKKGVIFICPYCPATFNNVANLKQHMIRNSCANMQPGGQTMPRGDIVSPNPTQEEEAEEENRQ